MTISKQRICAVAALTAAMTIPASAATISGKIDAFSTVKRKDADVQHALVRIETKQGDKAIVDLGPRLGTKKLDLKRGKQIEIEGSRSKMNDRTVLRAQQIEVGDKTFRPVTTTTLKGTVDGFKEVELKERPDKNLLVRVTLQNGKKVILDLGSKAKLGKLDMQAGDQIKAKGIRRESGDKQILVAQNVMIKDKDSDETYRFVRGDKSRQQARSQRQRDREMTRQRKQEQRDRAMGRQRNQQQRDRMHDRQAKRDRRRGSHGQMSKQGKQDRCPHCQAKVEVVGMSGTIDAVKDVQVGNQQGQSDTLTLVKLKLKNGRNQIVNIGPEFADQALGLEQGDEIAFYGVEREFRDREVLVVTDLIVID